MFLRRLLLGGKHGLQGTVDEWMYLTWTLMLVGICGIGIFALQFPGSRKIPVFAGGLLIAGASGVVGALVGTLFGIPRAGQRNGVELAYVPNTNLEQVSDWLTKGLVGIGLVQVGRLPRALGRLADSLRGVFGNAQTSGAFGLAVVIYFWVCGFFVGYLWFRLLLASALQTAEKSRGQPVADETMNCPGSRRPRNVRDPSEG